MDDGSAIIKTMFWIVDHRADSLIYWLFKEQETYPLASGAFSREKTEGLEVSAEVSLENFQEKFRVRLYLGTFPWASKSRRKKKTTEE